MFLRIVAISLLVLIAIRLLGRMLATLLGGPAGRPPKSRAKPDAGRAPQQRKLEPCPHCGTYFDPERALTTPESAGFRFCSPACLEAHALEGPAAGRSNADSPKDGSAA